MRIPVIRRSIAVAASRPPSFRLPAVVAAGRLWSAQIVSRATRSVQSAATQAATQAAARPRRRWLPIVVALVILLPSSKLAWALWPLLGNGNPIKDSELLHQLLSQSKREKLARSWGWLVSEASDRLIRDIYTAIIVVLEYIREGPKSEDWSALHQNGADKLLKLCQVNRGIYIKLAQHVGQLDYLLPHEYVSTLKILTHAAPVDTTSQVRTVIREEFGGREIEDVFDDFNITPIASASLAQVHMAKLKTTGETVAVKVQHSGLRETSYADIFTITLLVHVVKALFPKFDYEWLAEEIQDSLPKELNFTVEATNCTRANEAFRHRPDVCAPRIHSDLSTERVLTMSFESGVYVNNVAEIRRMGLKPEDVARLVAEAFAEQIFVHGRVHCDPHFANLLIRPLAGSPGKPQLVLLDHGLYRDLNKDLRLNYAKMWRAIIFADEAGIRKYTAKLGAGDMYKLWASMLTTKSWDKVIDETKDSNRLRVTGGYSDNAETRGHAQQYADEIGEVLRKVPRELLLILKTNDCLRNVDMALGHPANNFLISARYIQRALNAERSATRPGLTSAFWNAYDTVALEGRLQAFTWYMSARSLMAAWGL